MLEPCAERGRALSRSAVSGRLRLGLEADRRGRRPQQTGGEGRQGAGRVGECGKVRPSRPPASRRHRDVRLREPEGRLPPLGRSAMSLARTTIGRTATFVLALRVITSGARLRRASRTQHLNRSILPGELARERVDLRLALCRDRRKVRTIAFEECTRVRRLAATVSGPLAAKLRNQRRHAADDLPVDHVELALRLAPCLFHARKLGETFGGSLQGDVLPCQPMKLDGPE